MVFQRPSKRYSRILRHSVALLIPRRFASGSWARLLKPVFAVDVSRCPRCKSDLEIIAAVLDPNQIARYLKHTGMPAAPPSRAGVKMRLANEECYECLEC